LRNAVGGGRPLPLDDFAAWLRGRQVDAKRTDAIEMVAAIRAHLAAGVIPLSVSYRFQGTGYYQAAARQSV
jgi:hypothetical protein